MATTHIPHILRCASKALNTNSKKERCASIMQSRNLVCLSPKPCFCHCKAAEPCSFVTACAISVPHHQDSVVHLSRKRWASTQSPRHDLRYNQKQNIHLKKKSGNPDPPPRYSMAMSSWTLNSRPVAGHSYVTIVGLQSRTTAYEQSSVRPRCSRN